MKYYTRMPLIGIISKAGDVDHFAFSAKKGDLLDVTAFAYCIGSPLDTVVSVLTADGTLFAANDDETHNSRVRFAVPADGTYFIRVQDKHKQGRPRFICRLEIENAVSGLAVFLPTPARKSQNHQVIAVPRGGRIDAQSECSSGFDGFLLQLVLQAVSESDVQQSIHRSRQSR